MKKLLFVLVIALAGAGAWEWNQRHASDTSDVAYRTVKVEKGEVTEGVAASGAVQPLVSVQIGSQVSGVVARWFKDFNAKVEAGETIAVLETGRLTAQVEMDEAAVDRARADAEHVEAQIWQAERDFEREDGLKKKDVIAQSELDAAIANLRLLRANREVAAAVVSQNLAQLKSDRLNLKHATITSPIDGVVISRHIDVGQTVAASLQAPTLFVIANDLTKIQVQASVPESDIGRIREGQKARFTFDTYPGKKFEGVVSQVRLVPVTSQNVVTYTVLVDADNPDGRFFPGMTANVVIEIEKTKKDALRVPVAATRYKPSPSLIESDVKTEKEAKEAKGHEIVSESAIPAAVIEARLKAYPNARVAAWVRAGKSFEAELEDSGRKIEVEYEADGATVEAGAEIALGEAPEPVQATVRGSRFAKMKLARLKRNTKPGAAAPAYKAVFKEHERAWKVEIDEKGKLLEEKEIEGEELAWQTQADHTVAPPTVEKKPRAKVWIKGSRGLRSIPVKLGLTDGTFVAIEPVEKGALDEGTELVVGVHPRKDDLATNPFGPSGKSK
ncbi:MAG TPA: efflux RND transporter periplasmic adaptor subunit [Planctomycetota bacterium]|nr:efflux RND transporter periplasmic adaptor subunit [Planctomycetota bacterium]